MRAKQVFEFVKNGNPKNSLNLGYEGKIRSFFRQYGITDEKYSIEDDGK
jgi:hypothetical protein